jgi:hypothetical protein
MDDLKIEDMPRWKCHKVVRAMKISGVDRSLLRLYLDGGRHTLGVTQAWWEKNDPCAPGYYVVYNDGYASWSPAGAFEDGYTPLRPCRDMDVGDWVTHDLSFGQIKKIDYDEGMAIFSDGSFETSGRLLERFRPLTLKNKRIVETMNIYYNRLKEIDGDAGFNYPDIHSYFSKLARDAIDAADPADAFELAQQFVRSARSYTPTIDGVKLFRPRL